MDEIKIVGDVVRDGLFCTECPKYKDCNLECNEIKEN